jgi:hypothetical protein
VWVRKGQEVSGLAGRQAAGRLGNSAHVGRSRLRLAGAVPAGGGGFGATEGGCVNRCCGRHGVQKTLNFRIHYRCAVVWSLFSVVGRRGKPNCGNPPGRRSPKEGTAYEGMRIFILRPIALAGVESWSEASLRRKAVSSRLFSRLTPASNALELAGLWKNLSRRPPWLRGRPGLQGCPPTASS